MHDKLKLLKGRNPLLLLASKGNSNRFFFSFFFFPFVSLGTHSLMQSVFFFFHLKGVGLISIETVFFEGHSVLSLAKITLVERSRAAFPCPVMNTSNIV